MEHFKIVGDLIIENSLPLARRLNKEFDQELVHNEFRSDEMEGLHQWRAKIISLVGRAIKVNSKESVWEEVTEWAKMTGESAVKRELSLDESLKTLTSYRQVIYYLIEGQVDNLSITAYEMIAMNNIIDPILDHTGYIFSTSYVQYHRRTMDLAQKAIQELSVPVVALSDEVAILPLIGELDTNRARILKETSLQRCVELGNHYLIIDLSGVPIIDTMVANEIFQVISALKLIGVNSVLTGLRPEIAQSMIHLGIDFSHITVKNSLKSAVKHLAKIT